MKKVFVMLAMLVLTFASAQDLSQEQVENLKACQASVRSIDRLQQDGLLNEEQAAHYRQEQLQLAGVITDQSLTAESLNELIHKNDKSRVITDQSLTAESLNELIHKNDKSRFWGFFTFINIVWVFAWIILAIALTWF